MQKQLPKPWLTSGGVEIPTEQIMNLCQNWDPPTWERYLKWYESGRHEALVPATLYSEKCEQMETIPNDSSAATITYICKTSSG